MGASTAMLKLLSLRGMRSRRKLHRRSSGTIAGTESDDSLRVLGWMRVRGGQRLEAPSPLLESDASVLILCHRLYAMVSSPSSHTS